MPAQQFSRRLLLVGRLRATDEFATLHWQCPERPHGAGLRGCATDTLRKTCHQGNTRIPVRLAEHAFRCLGGFWHVVSTSVRPGNLADGVVCVATRQRMQGQQEQKRIGGPVRQQVDTGAGLWYPALQTADGVLLVVDGAADSPEWALRRALRQSEHLLGLAVNRRDARGGLRDQGIGARVGPAHWFGTLAPRELRIVRLLAVRAASVTAVVAAVAGYLRSAAAAAAYLAARVVRTVRVINLTEHLAERGRQARERLARVVPAMMRAPAAGGMPGKVNNSDGFRAAVARLLGSGRPGALALAGVMGVDMLRAFR